MNAPHRVTQQSGYTLIEIMIVVAIMGILAVIAIPAYQRYVAQGEVGSGLATISPVKTIVESSFGSGVEGTEITVDSLSVRPNANSLGTITLLFDTNGTGNVTFTYGLGSSPRVLGGSLVLTRDGGGSWTCSTTGGVADFRPPGCV